MYDGLGQLVSSALTQIGQISELGGSTRYGMTETQSYDALGNIATAATQDAYQFYAPNAHYSRSTQRNRQSAYLSTVGRLMSEATEAGTKSYRYDNAGNTEFASLAPGLPGKPVDDRFTYYSADGQVRAADHRYVQDGRAEITPAKQVFEEYRYDALGRRIWVRAYHDCANYVSTDAGYPDDCLGSVLRRTIWDGASELIESQVPGDAAQTAAVLEDDDSQAVQPRVNSVDPNPFYGRVLYIHGLETDRPVATVRYNYVDYFYPRTPTHFPLSALSLFWNTRGQLTLSACGLGTQTCIANNYAMATEWPAAYFAYDRPKVANRAFQGTLLFDKLDGVQTLYRRNRSYDPQTGRFTQEDPIGLAGGMNLYGFAGGDPVSYSDPFGLMGCKWHDVACWEDQMLAASGGTGVSGRVLAPLASTVLEITGATGVDAHSKAAAGGSRAGMALLALDIGVNAIPGGGEGKAALSALMRDAAENPGAWRVLGTFTEEALGKGLKGGTSIQTIIENQAGDRLVQHTLLDRSGNVAEQHYRPMYKPRDVDKP